MTPVPPLDEKTLKSYPYFWNWLKELARDWSEVSNMSIDGHIREVPSDSQWKKVEPTDYFTAMLTFSDGLSVYRDGKYSDGLMTYVPVEDEPIAEVA